ncbi:MAG TPA: hypothetical protein VFK19_07050 [Sphingomicrobium sp.]|nr:hypothetical protein [Sphingomicrobium sp.]
MISPVIFSIAIAAANPQTPQVPPVSGNEAIVVTGTKETRKTVEQFVRSLTPTIWQGQISRFEHSVCPAVYGLAKPQAEAVTNRMRLVAKSVGIVVEGHHCGPNVLLIVTSDKRALLQELERHRGEIFGGMPRSHVRDMERDSAPTAAWQLRGRPISASGMDLRWDAKLGAWMNYTTDAASHITEGSRPQFDGAVVVIERKALAGLTVTQLADYAAIRALTGADPAKLGNSGAPTILHVLDVPMGGETPITMTKWDLAFLKGFYDVHRNLRANAQRSAITDNMIGTIQKPPGK